MRPVRFVALSEDGHAFVLADEVGRLLALPNDDRLQAAMRPGPQSAQAGAAPVVVAAHEVSLSPRDIQARIRAGESADDVARIAGVPVERVLRYAGPVLQERAMLAQQARRARLKSSEKGVSLAEAVDGRLAQHGVDAEKIAWDAYRRDDGTWRVVATWPSGKATAQAVWELDRTRSQVTPHDDMAQYLCAERPMPVSGADVKVERAGRGLAPPTRGEGRGGHEPMRPADGTRREQRPGRGLDSSRAGDAIRAGRDALLASLERPLGSGEPGAPADAGRPHAASGAAGLLGRGSGGSAFDDDPDAPKEVPAVPSLAVLRPRRAGAAGDQAAAGGAEQPRKRLPSWDDVLFGSAPARESG